MSSELMDLTIVIVNWNTRELLCNCLESVYTGIKGIRFEVFVVVVVTPSSFAILRAASLDIGPQKTPVGLRYPNPPTSIL